MPAEIFVGEVAYMTDRNSSATTVISKGSEVIEWSFEDLKRRAAKNQRFKMAIEAVISKDLAIKVASAVAPDSEGAEIQGNR